MSVQLKSLLKYLFAIALLVFVLQRAGTDKIIGYLHQLTPMHWLLALGFATLAQIASAMRMRFFFRASGVDMSTRYALVLYYVGAFYNFLLPGGIGGDAYKVMLARKRFELPGLQGVRAMIADRASGLCVLLLIMLVVLARDPLEEVVGYPMLLLMLAGAVVLAGYCLCSRWFLGMSARTMLGSLPYSMAVQGFWIAILPVVSDSLHGAHTNEYIALYCAASIASLIPVSPGGLGIKEMTYYYGASLFEHVVHIPVDGEFGIALSLCMFSMMFITSLPGLLWLHKVSHMDV